MSEELLKQIAHLKSEVERLQQERNAKSFANECALEQAKRSEIVSQILRRELEDTKRRMYDRLAYCDSALATLERNGYRHCDIPACNCNGWHKVT